jgi:hypothetical protein
MPDLNLEEFPVDEFICKFHATLNSIHNTSKPLISKDKFELILALLNQGVSLSKICANDDMPYIGTFLAWLSRPGNEEYQDRYARAREQCLDIWMLQIADIAHDQSRDVQELVEVEESESRGRTVKTRKTSDNTAVNRDRLRVDTIQRVAARLLPQKYGDSVKQQISGQLEIVPMLNYAPKVDASIVPSPANPVAIPPPQQIESTGAEPDPISNRETEAEPVVLLKPKDTVKRIDIQSGKVKGLSDKVKRVRKILEGKAKE